MLVLVSLFLLLPGHTITRCFFVIVDLVSGTAVASEDAGCAGTGAAVALSRAGLDDVVAAVMVDALSQASTDGWPLAAAAVAAAAAAAAAAAGLVTLIFLLFGRVIIAVVAEGVASSVRGR